MKTIISKIKAFINKSESVESINNKTGNEFPIVKKYLYKWSVKNGDKVKKGQLICYYVEVEEFEKSEWHSSKKPIYSPESGYLERKKKQGQKSFFTDFNKLFYIHKESFYKKENSPKKSVYTCHFYWENIKQKLKPRSRNVPLCVVEHLKFEGDFVEENEVILTIGFEEAINEFEEYDETYDIAEIGTLKSGYLHIEPLDNKKWIFDGHVLFQIFNKQEYEEFILKKEKEKQKSELNKLDIVINKVIKTNENQIDFENTTCYVYLMIDTTNNFHKIGISNSPEYREKTLQSEKPTIELIVAKEYLNRNTALNVEKNLHKIYKKNRIRGEWFKLSENDIRNIKEKMESKKSYT